MSIERFIWFTFDEGKAQVSTFNKVFAKHSVPVIGIAKRRETLIIPTGKNEKVEFIQINLATGPAKNLVQRLRDEAHRFARRYHHTLLRKSLVSK